MPEDTVDGPAPAGDVTVLFDERETVVLLSGEIDLGLAEDMEQSGRDVVSRDFDVVVDCSAVTFMDSIGLAFLIRLAAGARRRQRGVTLRNPDDSVLDVLHLTGSTSLFRVETADERDGEPSAS